ncbi:hypothetical protein L0244_40455 [bacterium]|nr:hypothetical protein [bacterium]
MANRTIRRATAKKNAHKRISAKKAAPKKAMAKKVAPKFQTVFTTG